MSVDIIGTSDPPIFKLPLELLSHIFLLNVERGHWQDYSQQVHSSIPATSLRAASQVCRHWRAIALGQPALWGRIIDFHVMPTRWVEELLSRSGSSPIDACLLRTESPDDLNMALAHAERFRTLDVFIHEAEWDLQVRKLQRPAPFLESFRIAAIRGELGGKTPVLPSALFGGYAPRLRRFDIVKCSFDLRSLMLHNLTDLRYISTPSDSSLSKVSEWLRILEGMPHLYKLCITLARVPFFDNHPEPHFTDVALPKLHYMYVKAQIQHVSALIEHMTVHAECSVRLECLDAQLGVKYNTFCELLQEKISLLPPLSAPSGLFIELQSCACRVRTGSDSWKQDGVGVHDAGDTNDPTWDVSIFHWYQDGIGTEVCDIFHPLRSVFTTRYANSTFIDLHFLEEFNRIYMPPEEIVSILREMTSVERLALTHHSFFNILRPIKEVIERVGSPSIILLPSLNALEFTEVNFDNPVQCFEVLISFLRHREEIGVAIRTVVFTRCEMAKDKEQILVLDFGIRAIWREEDNEPTHERDGSSYGTLLRALLPGI